MQGNAQLPAKLRAIELVTEIASVVRRRAVVAVSLPRPASLVSNSTDIRCDGIARSEGREYGVTRLRLRPQGSLLCHETRDDALR
jgi:hypothetical protein